jgi:poly-beta-1,6-N-acetyl-D-glucosamine N-deacetylase
MTKAGSFMVGMLLLFCSQVSAQITSDNEGPELLALCYHDVVTTSGPPLDESSVTVDMLVQQFSWLAGHGYQPISLSQWRAAKDASDLPDKPVLLTFDDGYASFLKHVLPLLELFKFPAVLAPVTSWIDAPMDQPVLYGGEPMSRDHFLTWRELKEIKQSGLVEIVSHSHDMHNTMIANQFGSQLPTVTARAYDMDASTYETDAMYRSRIRQDLERGNTLLLQNIGIRADTMVWPYGAYNSLSNDIAAELGLTTYFTLDGTPNTLGKPGIHRYLVSSTTELQDLARAAQDLDDPISLRATYIDMDELYDPDSARMAHNLDLLLDRIKTMQIGTVFLKAFSDQDSSGLAEAMYFPNRHLPMRADLLNRVAWQLRTRAEVTVYMWMPVSALGVLESQAKIREIYEDLGRSSIFRGILFGNEVPLRDHTMLDPSSAQNIASATGVPHWLVDNEFTLELAEILRAWQPALLTARMITATNNSPERDALFIDNYLWSAQHYNYLVVVPPKDLPALTDQGIWLKSLLQTAQQQYPNALVKTIFQLNPGGENSQDSAEEKLLVDQFDLLLSAGANHIAYYPDRFLIDKPRVDTVHSWLSTNTFPAVKK